MASERQPAANGRNGRQGGPKTDTGKQWSRGNSLKHGLSASTLVVLPQEKHHEYEAVLPGFRESYQPHDAIAVGFMTMPAERWQMYLRYDTTISRDFFRTLDALTRLQRVRRRNARRTDNARPVPDSSTCLTLAARAGAQLSDSGIRSVSQNDIAVACDANAGMPDADVNPACSDTVSPLEPSSSGPVNRRGADIAAFDKAVSGLIRHERRARQTQSSSA